MRGWNWFFAIISVLIIVTQITPSVFGLNNFTQWGGMYSDGWCTAFITATPVADIANPSPDAQIAQIQNPTTRVVWYAPMHNAKTCTAWVQSHCDGSVAAYPYFRQTFLMDGKNICGMDMGFDGWFLQS